MVLWLHTNRLVADYYFSWINQSVMDSGDASCISFEIFPLWNNRSDLVPPPSAHLLISHIQGHLWWCHERQGHPFPLWYLIGSFYPHANHVSGDRECTGLIMPNTLLTGSYGALEGTTERKRKEDREEKRDEGKRVKMVWGQAVESKMS